MNLPTLVWRNLVRRRGRFAFTLAGTAIGVAAFVALLTIGQGLTRDVHRQAQGLGADLVVTPKGWCAYEQISVLTGEQLPEAIPEADVAKIVAVPGLKAVVPHLNEQTAFRNRPVPVIGVVPAEMRALRGWTVSEGRYFASADEAGVVLGSAIAQQFALKPGDAFTVRGRPVPVLGVLRETGTKDDIATFVPLALAQQLYGVEGKVSFLTVRVADLSQIEQAKLAIEEAANVSVVSDRQLVSSILSIVGAVGSAMQAVAAVGVLAAAFGILNTLLTAVYERRREIGILQAIGGTRRILFAAFILESMLYGLLGGAGGVALGGVAARLLGPYFAANNGVMVALQAAPTAVLPDVSTIFAILLSSTIVAIVAGLYPAARAAQLSPVEAMRHV
ncbi:MAG: ABC transporter permease [Magnetospirillum sp.]|nr:ABC transporter permease [Magnetospirillum sp.]